MTPRRRKGSTVGEKVEAWLLVQRKAKRAPYTPTALAREIGVDQSTVVNWISKGRWPRSDHARDLARAMNAPLWWLLDDQAPAEPMPSPDSLGDFLAGCTAEERTMIIRGLSSPAGLRVLLALGESRE